jgi:hypothetical protein
MVRHKQAKMLANDAVDGCRRLMTISFGKNERAARPTCFIPTIVLCISCTAPSFGEYLSKKCHFLCCPCKTLADPV